MSNATVSNTDRDVLRSLCPLSPLHGLSDADLDDFIDAWFAHDHFDDNTVYADADNEGDDQ